MLLASSIFVVIFTLFQKENDGKMWVKNDKKLTIRIFNILFAPSAIYIIYFVLYYFKIIK